MALSSDSENPDTGGLFKDKNKMTYRVKGEGMEKRKDL